MSIPNTLKKGALRNLNLENVDNTSDASKVNSGPIKDALDNKTNKGSFIDPFDYGAKADGVTDDSDALQNSINAAIAGGKKGIKLATGANYVVTLKQLGNNGLLSGLRIASAKNLYIDGNGSTILHKAINAGFGNTLRIENSSSITIDNLGFDYLYLPFTQGVLSSINTTNKTATFSLDEGFPVAWDSVNVIEGFSTTTNLATSYVIQGGANRAATVSGNNLTVDFSASGDQAELTAMTIGNKYIITRQKYGSDAISIDGVDNITLNRVPLYASAGMGIHCFNTKNIIIENSGPRLKPGRSRSTNADAMHFTDIRGLLTIKNSLIEGMGDDGINAYPLGRTIVSVSGNNFVIPEPVNATASPIKKHCWKIGDIITFVSAGGLKLGTAAITSLNISNAGGNLTVGTAGLPSNTTTGTYVFNSSATALINITSNTFYRIHGAAVMFQSERGRISNNFINGTTSEAISVGGPYWSYFNEGGLPIEVVVDNNDITNANNGPPNVSYAGGAITAFRTSPDRTENNPPAGLLGSVSIRNNRIRNTRGPCVYASSIASLDLGPNTCDAWALNPDAGALFGHAAHAFVIFNVGSGRVTPGTLLNSQPGGLRGYINAANSANVVVNNPTINYWPFIYNGFGYTTPDDSTNVRFHANDTVGALNIVLPAKPIDQQLVSYTTDRTITNLNIYPANNQSINAVPVSTLAQYGRIEYYWSQQYSIWTRVQ